MLVQSLNSSLGVLSAFKDPSQNVNLQINQTSGTDQVWKKVRKADVAGTCDGWIKLQLETRQFELSDMFLQLSISGEDLSVEVERTRQLQCVSYFCWKS